jgi:Methyl-accepting chemotaxis protein (MCP) signalling domain
MKKFNELKLKTQVYTGSLVSIVLFTTLAGFTYLSIVSKIDRQNKFDRVVETAAAIDDAAYASAKVVRSVRGYALDPTPSRLQSIQPSHDEGLKEYQADVARLNTLIPEAERPEELKTLLKESAQAINIYEEGFKLMKTGQLPKGITVINEVEFRPVEESRLKLQADNQAKISKLRADEQAATNALVILITLGTGVAIVSSLTLSWLIISWITTKIQQATSDITTSSSQMMTTMDEQERIASQQATAVNETTTTMDELEASCRQSAEQAQASVGAAKHALALVKEGSLAVGQTKEGMFTLEQKVEAIADQIINLSSQANQVSSISQLVSDLANQTNMLALNSSVEAVRAGEHGKGFAVVANEIRKLADQSQQASEKISTLVSGIQKAINSTVMVTDEGTKTAKQGVQIAQATDRTFTGVKDAVDQVVLNNQQVSLNLKQQVDAIQQVVEAMETINRGARETVTGLTQTKAGSQKLNQTALVLKEIV